MSLNNGPVLFSRAAKIGILSAIACQIVLLIVAGVNNRYQLNPDAVSYIRIASYYADAKLDLAVSGLWSPMLSWLIAPLLGWVANPLYAARIIMGLSALVYVLACLSLFRSLQIHPVAVVICIWIVAVRSVSWSSSLITPDLLVSGLIFVAVSQLISAEWVKQKSVQTVAGVTLGAAYLAKAVALPMGCLLVLGIGLVRVLCRLNDLKAALRASGLTLLAFLLTAAPWIVILSTHFHRLTTSTAGKSAYIEAGPVADHQTNLVAWHRPEPGRITKWEGYSEPPGRFWSPFESWFHFEHLLIVIYRNIGIIAGTLAHFDLLRLGLFAVLASLLLHFPWQENMRSQRWRWAAIPVIGNALVYLPFVYYDERYYYPSYPFLLAATVSLIMYLTRGTAKTANLPWLVGSAIVMFSFAVPALEGLRFLSPYNDHNPVPAYVTLASGLKGVGEVGPVAGSDDGSLLVAFLLDQPWYGKADNARAEHYKRSQAKLIVVDRTLPVIKELDRDPSFKDLDGLLFESKEEAAKSWLKVYQVRPSREPN